VERGFARDGAEAARAGQRRERARGVRRRCVRVEHEGKTPPQRSEFKACCRLLRCRRAAASCSCGRSRCTADELPALAGRTRVTRQHHAAGPHGGSSAETSRLASCRCRRAAAGCALGRQAGELPTPSAFPARDSHGAPAASLPRTCLQRAACFWAPPCVSAGTWEGCLLPPMRPCRAASSGRTARHGMLPRSRQIAGRPYESEQG
jgi:hypothetical protein